MRAAAISVDDATLREAPAFLQSHGGSRTTPSGAAGLAGLRHALADPALARTLDLDPSSRTLLLVTEASPA